MAATGWVSVALLAAIGASALAGLALLYFALLHDRSRGRRRCPKCWYDLSGNTDSRTCPECGHSAAIERVLYRTRRRPWRASFGCALLVAAVLMAMYGRIDVQQIKPVWLLTYEMYADGQRGEDARRELVRRGRDGRLSIGHQQRLADHVLAIQADPDADWLQGSYPAARDSSWSAIFEEAWLRGALREEQVQQYFRAGFEMNFAFDHRARVRAGEPIPVRFVRDGAPRVYRWQHLDTQRESYVLRVTLESVVGVDPERPALPRVFAGNTSRQSRPTIAAIPSEFTLGSSRSGGAGSRRFLPGIHTPGEREVAINLEFTVVSVADGMRSEQGRALARWRRTETFTVQVLAQDESPVVLIDDPSLEQAIRDALQIELQATQVEIGGTMYGGRYGMVLVHPTLPIDIGFDVFVRAGEREEWIGSIHAYRDIDRIWPGMRIQNAQRITVDAWALFDDEIVDVILRANPAAAEITLDITEIWNGEITIENVRLR